VLTAMARLRCRQPESAHPSGVQYAGKWPRDRTNAERIARGDIDALATAPQDSLSTFMTQHPCFVCIFRHIVTNDIAVIRQSVTDNGRSEFDKMRLEGIEPPALRSGAVL
jgi:hypothetical protein